MFGGAIPDLATTPCPGCDQAVDLDEVVWDPYHHGDRRLCALPYHPRCAADLLPPNEPTDVMRVCAICCSAFDEATLTAAFKGLHQRFGQPKATVAVPEVVWRLAGREPRVFLAEHLACLLDTVRRAQPPGA